jgi:hypothetical protein
MVLPSHYATSLCGMISVRSDQLNVSVIMPPLRGEH